MRWERWDTQWAKTGKITIDKWDGFSFVQVPCAMLRHSDFTILRVPAHKLGKQKKREVFEIDEGTYESIVKSLHALFR